MQTHHRLGSNSRLWLRVLGDNCVGGNGAIRTAGWASNRRSHAPVDRLNVESISLAAHTLNLNWNHHMVSALIFSRIFETTNAISSYAASRVPYINRLTITAETRVKPGWADS